MAKYRLGHHRGKYRHWIGKTCRLDHRSPERKDLTALAPFVKVTYGGAEIAPDGAAEAAALKQYDVLVEPAQRVMIETPYRQNFSLASEPIVSGLLFGKGPLTADLLEL